MARYRGGKRLMSARERERAEKQAILMKTYQAPIWRMFMRGGGTGMPSTGFGEKFVIGPIIVGVGWFANRVQWAAGYREFGYREFGEQTMTWVWREASTMTRKYGDNDILQLKGDFTAWAKRLRRLPVWAPVVKFTQDYLDNLILQKEYAKGNDRELSVEAAIAAAPTGSFRLRSSAVFSPGFIGGTPSPLYVGGDGTLTGELDKPVWWVPSHAPCYPLAGTPVEEDRARTDRKLELLPSGQGVPLPKFRNRKKEA